MVIEISKDKELMTEDYLRAIGAWSKWLLNRMFPGGDIGIKLKEEDMNTVLKCERLKCDHVHLGERFPLHR